MKNTNLSFYAKAIDEFYDQIIDEFYGWSMKEEGIYFKDFLSRFMYFNCEQDHFFIDIHHNEIYAMIADYLNDPDIEDDSGILFFSKTDDFKVKNIETPVTGKKHKILDVNALEENWNKNKALLKKVQDKIFHKGKAYFLITVKEDENRLISLLNYFFSSKTIEKAQIDCSLRPYVLVDLEKNNISTYVGKPSILNTEEWQPSFVINLKILDALEFLKRGLTENTTKTETYETVQKTGNASESIRKGRIRRFKTSSGGRKRGPNGRPKSY
jgi:hypothetical protein